MNEQLAMFGLVSGPGPIDMDDALDSISGLVANACAGKSVHDIVRFLNEAKKLLHKAGPFKDEPVDCVVWVDADSVMANDYNPNSVAPPEMKLLEHSILSDGYTQPIVTMPSDDSYEVIDGFHRNRVGKECKSVRNRVLGYLPVVAINEGRTDRGDRIAATIRHNRARGKHRVSAMSDIVVELKRRNWSDNRIGKELGMDPDEVLRLTQITGLADMFSNQEFSASWEVDHYDEQIDMEEEDGTDIPHMG